MKIPRKVQFKKRKFASVQQAESNHQKISWSGTFLSNVALVVKSVFRVKECEASGCTRACEQLLGFPVKWSQNCRYHNETYTYPCEDEISPLQVPRCGATVSEINEFKSWVTYRQDPSFANMRPFLAHLKLKKSGLKLTFINTVTDVVENVGTACMSHVFDMVLCPIISKMVFTGLGMQWRWSQAIEELQEKVLKTTGESHTSYDINWKGNLRGKSKRIYCTVFWCTRYILDVIKCASIYNIMDTFYDWLKFEGASTSNHDQSEVIFVLASMGYQVNFLIRQIVAHACTTSLTKTCEFASCSYRGKGPLFLATKYPQMNEVLSMMMRYGLFPSKLSSSEMVPNLCAEEFLALIERGSTIETVENYVEKMFNHFTTSPKGALECCEGFVPLIFWEGQLLLLPFFYLAFIGHVSKWILCCFNKGGPFEFQVMRCTNQNKKKLHLVQRCDGRNIVTASPSSFSPSFDLFDKKFEVKGVNIGQFFFASDDHRNEILTLPNKISQAGIFNFNAADGLDFRRAMLLDGVDRIVELVTIGRAIVSDLRHDKESVMKCREKVLECLYAVIEVIVGGDSNNEEDDEAVVDTACVYNDDHLEVGNSRRKSFVVDCAMVQRNQEQSKVVEAQHPNNDEATDDDDEATDDDDDVDFRTIYNAKFLRGKQEWVPQTQKQFLVQQRMNEAEATVIEVSGNDVSSTENEQHSDYDQAARDDDIANRVEVPATSLTINEVGNSSPLLEEMTADALVDLVFDDTEKLENIVLDGNEFVF